MKDIKFRVWDDQLRFFRNDIESFKVEDGKIREVLFHNGVECYVKKQNFISYPSVQIQQYTGLKDKNGNEIYEGDLLLGKYEDEEGFEFESHYPVFFNTDKADWAIDNSFAKDGSSAVNLVTYFDKGNLIVSGNIYDNPELL